ncbi:MAG: FtsQ-type POTRA domain-containing protein [Dehalococcoidia bacterium]|nr:FtsQ-type POTRA domain-containing protein [Dehalococcoidia bacterium]
MFNRKHSSPIPSPVINQAGIVAARLPKPWRYRGWLSLILKVAAVMGGLTIGVSVFRSPVFAVSEIEITGLHQLPQSRISERFDVHGANILALQTDDLRTAALKDPWVRSVGVQRRLPGKLSVAVTEREAAAVWQVQGRQFLIDRDGTILEETRNRTGLPVIRDQDGSLPTPGETRSAETVALARTLMEVVPNELGEKAVDFEYLSYGGLVVETDRGHRARFGDASDFQWKLAIWKAVLKEADAQQMKATHIDLRFGDRPFFRS